MDNPNIASGSSSTPNALDRVGSKATFPVGPSIDAPQSKAVGTSYQLSNANTVSRSPTQVSGTGTNVAGQASMSVPSTKMSFDKVQPKMMPTTPGPMGTDHKP